MEKEEEVVRRRGGKTISKSGQGWAFRVVLGRTYRGLTGGFFCSGISVLLFL